MAATLTHAPEPAADALAAFEHLARMLKAGDEWMIAASPALPLAWPVGDTGLVRYGYAWRFVAETMNGVEISAPFARCLEGTTAGFVAEALEGELLPLGLQGVRPLTGEEVELTTRQADVEMEWREGILSPLGIRFFRAWMSQNGVIAANIVARHQAFISALGAPPGA